MTYIWAALWPAPFAACLVVVGSPPSSVEDYLEQTRLEDRGDGGEAGGGGGYGSGYYHRLDLLGGRCGLRPCWAGGKGWGSDRP